MSENKITRQPEWDALHKFDADNNVEPSRTIAERIGERFQFVAIHPIIDAISHAIEDAMRLGERRAEFLPQSVKNMDCDTAEDA
jgi:hypothetical protein